MLSSLPVDLLGHILANLSLISLIFLSRVCHNLRHLATTRVNEAYKNNSNFRISTLYEEYLIDPHPVLELKIRAIIDSLCPDEHDSLHVVECLLGDRTMNSVSRPLPLKCDSDVLTLVLQHCKMETPFKLTAFYFDHLSFGVLERHISKAISNLEIFAILLNCEGIRAVNTLRPFLHEPNPFLLRLLETMDPSEESLSDFEPTIEGICLACRLCYEEYQIAPILSHVSRCRNHTSDLWFLFDHLILKKINPILACCLYKMLPKDEDTRRTTVLAIALAGFDLALYEAIRGPELLPHLHKIVCNYRKDIKIQIGDFPIYQIVEAAVIIGADEPLVLELLSHPLLEHDADLIYTAVYRGYSEKVLLAIMASSRVGWYRSGHCLLNISPHAFERLPLSITIDVPASVLKGLFNASIKSEFYSSTGPEVYSDDCYAPFLEYLLQNSYSSHIAVAMATRDRLQRMPKSLAVIWGDLLRTGQDYDITKVSACYQAVHRRRLKAFFRDHLPNPDIVDTAKNFSACKTTTLDIKLN